MTTRALVLGGSMTGMLAAAVLAEQVDEVVVLERERYPSSPGPRRGVPQARHAHLLMSGGARIIDDLLPGTTDRLVAAGAHRLGHPTDVVALTSQGWLRRLPATQYVLTCSRSLLDHVVRERALASGRIEVRTGTEITALLVDASRMTGAAVRDVDTGDTGELRADLVLDASGRCTCSARWFTELGLPAVAEEMGDAGLAYSSRSFRAPAGAESGFPLVLVSPDPTTGRPGQGGAVVPIEDGRWLVTLGGTRGGTPPTGDDEFAGFARELRHPIVAELIAAATPDGPVHGFRGTANRRRRFELVEPWPAGFLVIGDAMATFNPVYGHGMSVAAFCASSLRVGLHDGLETADIQTTIALTVNDAWAMAIAQDLRYPDAIGPRPGASAGIKHWLSDRMTRTATTRPAVAEALVDVMTLAKPAATLGAPRELLNTLLGPGRRTATRPPLSEQERTVLAGRPASAE